MDYATRCCCKRGNAHCHLADKVTQISRECKAKPRKICLRGRCALVSVC